MVAVILGKKWKAEPDRVKAEWKKLPEVKKAKHLREHPGYQYAPRKPSEKKRRMTARKAAELAKSGSMHALEDLSDDDMSETSMPGTADTEEMLGTNRPDDSLHLGHDEEGRIELTLPVHDNHALQAMLDDHTTNMVPDNVQPFDPVNQHQITPAIAPHVQNDQEFVDSLIDWEGIAADFAMVKEATAEDMAELAGVELGDHYLGLSEEDQRRSFEAELERTMHWFG